MKISQRLTPAAFEFGCTSAACAPPNRKGTGGTGGSIKGQTKGGGPNFHEDMRQISILRKAMERPTTDKSNDKGFELKGTDKSNDKGMKLKGTDKSNDKDMLWKPTNAGGGRSSMMSSVDNDKSRAIAAKRGDPPAGRDKYANRDEKTGLPSGYPEPASLRDKEHEDHDNQVNTRTGGISKAEQRAIDFKREKAKFDATVRTPAQKAAARKKRENSAKLSEYQKMMRDRNRIL